MRVIRTIKSWTTGFEEVNRITDDFLVLWEFYEAGEAGAAEVDQAYAEAVEAIEKLEARNMLRNEEDRLGAVLRINAGAGGTESNDWASMLLRMYTRWGEQNGYAVKMMDVQPGDEAGIKSCTVEFEGDYAYGYLKSENGVHRLVRLSPFNAQNKRQTSFTSVFVAPWSTIPSKSKSTRATSPGIPSAAAAPADKMSTRWKRECACAMPPAASS